MRELRDSSLHITRTAQVRENTWALMHVFGLRALLDVLRGLRRASCRQRGAVELLLAERFRLEEGVGAVDLVSAGRL